MSVSANCSVVYNYIQDLLHPDLQETVASSQRRQKEWHDQHVCHRQLSVGQQVLVRNFKPCRTNMVAWHSHAVQRPTLL